MTLSLSDFKPVSLSYEWVTLYYSWQILIKFPFGGSTDSLITRLRIVLNLTWLNISLMFIYRLLPFLCWFSGSVNSPVPCFKWTKSLALSIRLKWFISFDFRSRASNYVSEVFFSVWGSDFANIKVVYLVFFNRLFSFLRFLSEPS